MIECKQAERITALEDALILYIRKFGATDEAKKAFQISADVTKQDAQPHDQACCGTPPTQT